MILFVKEENLIVNMDKVATIQAVRQYEDGALDIDIRTTAIKEWPYHTGKGPGFSPFEMTIRIKEETWWDLIKAFENNKKFFILEKEKAPIPCINFG